MAQRQQDSGSSSGESQARRSTDHNPGQRAAGADPARPDVADLVIGILGGTGAEGRGLARRFAMAGHTVLIGSRSPDRAPPRSLASTRGRTSGGWRTPPPRARPAS